jgi:hypothetical protein
MKTPVYTLIAELDRLKDCSDIVKMQIIEGMLKDLIELERQTIICAIRSQNGKCIGDEIISVSQKEAEKYYEQIAG